MNTPVVGNCKWMCPRREFIRREKERRLSVFEVATTEHGTSAADTAVKEYVRAGAGHERPDADELRPPSVLVRTIDHLIRHIADRHDHPWYVVYSFVNDRIQAIRQDITYQQLEGGEVDYILAVSIRFYLYSQYRLCNCALDKFDPKLNVAQLHQCMVKLLRTCTLNEGHQEFYSYYLLINLGLSEAVDEIIGRVKDWYLLPQLKLAVLISICFMDNNFVRFFRLIRQLTSLEQCAVLLHIKPFRSNALRVLSTAYSSKNNPFPLRSLQEWLGFNDVNTVKTFCMHCGMDVQNEMVFFRKTTNRSDELPLDYTIHELSGDSFTPSTICSASVHSTP